MTADSANEHQQQQQQGTNFESNNGGDGGGVCCSWGDWMGSWKESLDEEAERIDRQRAAFGGDTVARIKDLNVLILGCKGVGVETAKNLILSNVGSVTLWDPHPARLCDLGTNFYLSASKHCGTGTGTGTGAGAGAGASAQPTPRAQAILNDLKSLNPFCKVDVLTETAETSSSSNNDNDNSSSSSTCPYTFPVSALLTPNVHGTGKPYRAVVVTEIMPNMTQINDICRQNGIAFVLAFNHGVTASIFSDFGTHHEITNEFGEPTQILAVSNMEVLDNNNNNSGEIPPLLRISGCSSSSTSSTNTKKLLILTVAQTDHGLDDGDKVVLDDMRGPFLAPLNGKQFTVKRIAFQSPTEAKVNTTDAVFAEILKQPTRVVVENFQKQYDYYYNKFQQEQEQEQDDGDNNNNSSGGGSKTNGKPTKKFQTRTITMFNRLALVMEDDEGNTLLPDDFTVEKLASSYESGGLLQQVRPPITRSYHSLQETLEGGGTSVVPQMLRGEDWEAGKGIDVHLAVAAVLDFYQEFERWPMIHNEKDAEELLKHAERISAERQEKKKQQEDASLCWAQKVSFGFPTGEPREVDQKLVKRFARLFQTELTGLCAFLGGAAAQEVIKTTGKFTPLNQWIHHDEHVLVTDECPSNIMPLFGSRYDHQLAIMGKDFQAKAAEQRVFLVGCGALGCEYLKGLALMGVATGKHGKIYVTDMDRIEVSNLSRQFLFRDSDVGHPKSVSGARVVKGWNPQMNICALEKKVWPDTEDFFDDTFWESLDVCWNALDNVVARKYTDSRCLLYAKPLLESGTLGTKCNHEVILPFRTSTYNDGKESDENENQIAMCTLRLYPYLPLHCIEFAKQAYFSDYFEFGPDQYETFRKNSASFFEQLDSMEAGEQLKSLRMIQSYINTQKHNGDKMNFSACVRVAFEHMMEDFRTSVLNLCYSADVMEKSSGERFWNGTKRRPRPIDWEENSSAMPELMEYLYCSSNMYAAVWGIEPVRDRIAFEKIVTDVGLKQPEWCPPTEKVNLSETDDGEGGGGSDDVAKAEKLKADLYSVDTSTLQPAHPHDFEKDDDSNFHIDFLTVATNLRSWNYDIKASPRHTVKVTAGRIIPALATTTAMVCGLVDVEFCKLVMGLQSLGRDKFLNSNINLAAGSGNFTTFSPDPPITLKTGLTVPHPETFTSWDKIEVTSEAGGAGEMSVEQLVQYLERTFGVTVDRIFCFGHNHSNSSVALYSAADLERLAWDISYDADDGMPVISNDGVFTKWPQLRTAVAMLKRLPATSGQRKIFENHVRTSKAALDKIKESFMGLFQGPVSVAFRNAYRPSTEEEEGEGGGENNSNNEKQEYFDSVFLSRDYLLLGVDCHTTSTATAAEENNSDSDIHLPCIKYIYKKGNQNSSSGDDAADVDDDDNEDDEHAKKRIRIEDKKE